MTFSLSRRFAFLLMSESDSVLRLLLVCAFNPPSLFFESHNTVHRNSSFQTECLISEGSGFASVRF